MRLHKPVLRHHRKSSLEGFQMFLSMGEAELAPESVRHGQKHSPQESFLPRNSLWAACKMGAAARMMLKLFITLEGEEEKKLDLMVFNHNFYLSSIKNYQ